MSLLFEDDVAAPAAKQKRKKWSVGELIRHPVWEHWRKADRITDVLLNRGVNDKLARGAVSHMRSFSNVAKSIGLDTKEHDARIDDLSREASKFDSPEMHAGHSDKGFAFVRKLNDSYSHLHRAVAKHIGINGDKWRDIVHVQQQLANAPRHESAHWTREGLLIEASLHAPESFRQLLSSLDSRSISDLVQMYGGANPAMYAMRGLSLKHQQTIPGNLHNLFKESEAEWQKKGSPGKKKPPLLPPLEYAFGDNVRTKDGQIKGKIIGLRRFNKDENAYMYRVSHHDEPAIITVHPHTLLQRDGVAVKRRNYNESERPMNKREAFDVLVSEGFSPDEAIEFLSEADLDEIGIGAIAGTALAAAPLLKKAAGWAAKKAAPYVKGAATAVGDAAKSAAGWVAGHVTPNSVKGTIAGKAAEYGISKGLPAFQTAGRATKGLMGPPKPGLLNKGAAAARLLGNTAASSAARSQVGKSLLGDVAKPAAVGAAALGAGAAAGAMVGGSDKSSASTPKPLGSPDKPLSRMPDSLPSPTPKPAATAASETPKPKPSVSADETPGGQTDFGVGGGVKKPNDPIAAAASAKPSGGGKSSFGQAFADARKAGKSTFSFEKGGRMQQFTTKLAGEGDRAHQRATASPAPAAAPSGPKPMKATTDSPGFRAPSSGFTPMTAQKPGGEVNVGGRTIPALPDSDREKMGNAKFDFSRGTTGATGWPLSR